jgi:hypothetical protein
VITLSSWMALVLTLTAGRTSPAAGAPPPPAVDQAATALPSSGPVTLRLRVAGGRRQFRPGELLPIELEFDSRIPHRFVVDGATYDRGGRLAIDQFRVEPHGAVTDPLADYFALGGGSFGGIRGIGVLGDKPYTVRLDLNEWVRFEKPGVYELSVRSQRVRDEADAAATTRPFGPVESNIVSFEIRPRDPEWEATELRAAVQVLDATASDVEHRRGCRMLRFLGTDLAVDEMIRRLDDGGGCDFEYMAGLVSAPDRDRVVRQLEAGLGAPDQPVSEAYLRTLALLSVCLRHPELRAPQTRDPDSRQMSSSEPERLLVLVQAAQAMYAELLDAALAGKSGPARARILSWRVAARAPTPGASRERLRDQLAATFLELSSERQTHLLEYQWPDLAGAAMAPALRTLAESASPASAALRDLALRRLYELAPDEGRARILREISGPRRGATLQTLGLLPDRELPELDEVLAGNLDAGQSFEAMAIRAELLHRYASPAVSARVLSRVDERLPGMACRPKAALLAYFLRADPDLGDTLLNRALASRSTGCHTSVLRDVAALRMTPGVEAVAVAHLDDPDPQVVISAAEALGRYGSRAAAPPLKAQFERWRRIWEGRQAELRHTWAGDHPNAIQGMVESTLLQALARGQGWVSDADGVRDLRGLCVTDACRNQVDHLIDVADDTRITIVRVDHSDTAVIMLAQYQLASIAALEQKLAQYPRGSRFTLDVRALDPSIASAVASALAKFAAAHSLTLER